MLLDFHTLITVNFLVNCINLLTMVVLWRRYGARYAGLVYWLAAMTVHVAGIGLILCRAMLPGFMVAVVANALLMSSTVWMLMGLQRFTGRRSSQWWNVLAFAVYLAALFYYHAVEPRLPMRNVVNSAIIVFVDLQCCLLIFRQAGQAMRRILLPVGLVMAGYVAASLARVAIIIYYPNDAELFRSGVADSVTIASYLCLHICLVISLAMAITRRLMDDVLAQEEKFAKAFHLAPYALVISRREDQRIVEVNSGFTSMFGYSRDEALGKSLDAFSLHSPAPGPRAEVQALRKSGERMVGQLASDDLQLNGEACVLSSISDITEEHQLKRQLVEMATLDSLTGLANRRHFVERFRIAQLQAERHRRPMAVLSMDLDKFKAVNDALGHSAGDAVLVEAARRLQDCLRKVDVVARFGGDEFVLLLTEVGGPEDAVTVAEKIIARFREPFAVEQHQVHASASIGIAMYPEHGTALDALLRHSDAALYRAKRAGRNDHCLADPGPCEGGS